MPGITTSNNTYPSPNHSLDSSSGSHSNRKNLHHPLLDDGLFVCSKCRSQSAIDTSPNNGNNNTAFNQHHGSIHPSAIKTRRRKSSTSSLVGSYEESLLSGRMSAVSSSPMSFYSKLGVIGGGGKTKSKKKTKKKTCPRHVSLPFEAVFYDWKKNCGETTTAEESSPYVGGIDIDSHYQGKDKPGYKVPRTGQIQLVVSNPRKTAVQLILVPYDLSDMPSNCKTFIRHKVFEDGSKLVQAVHIPIFSPPASSKLYIHGVIRTVFQNRVTVSTENMMKTNPQSKNTNTTTKVLYGGYSALNPPCSSCNQTLI